MGLMIGVILAGGRSSRMRVDKATVDVAGRPMIAWVATALATACETVVVAGGSGTDDLPLLPDALPAHRGPLAGVVTAMDNFPREMLAVVAVDQPWLRGDTVARLGDLAGGMAAAPVDGGVRQTTCAVYPPALADLARQELAGDGSLQSLLDLASFIPVVHWHEWGEDGRSWFSADTPDSLADGLDRFGPPPG